MDKISKYAWSRNIKEQLKKPGRPTRPPLTTIMKYLPKLYRMRRINKELEKQGIKTIDIISPMDDGEYQGLPIGGLGAGSIGRSFRGDFVRWQLDVGYKHYQTVHADQFSIRIESEGKPAKSMVLFNEPPKKGLEAWEWGNGKVDGDYYALFPFAWTSYKIDNSLEIVCQQITPFIPHDYQVSSYPCGIFEWYLKNNDKNKVTISLMFSWQNGTGTDDDKLGGHSNELIDEDDLLGIKFNYNRNQDRLKPFKMMITTKKDENSVISYQTRFNVLSDGKEIWKSFSSEGKLLNHSDDSMSSKNEVIAGAICVTKTLEPGETAIIPFVVAWDHPTIDFQLRSWYRRYTKFFGNDGNNVEKIARTALLEYGQWLSKIAQWQKSVIDEVKTFEGIPDWYFTSLFNELYYLIDGGTAWEHGEVGKSPPPDNYFGRFAYLECFEYRFYNTYDVHFYSSFALAMLFPEIEKNIIHDYAQNIIDDDPSLRKIVSDGRLVPRKPYGVVAHDLGSPYEDPWLRANYYNFQDVSRWKDLNSKFVLQVYRYWMSDKKRNRGFLKKVWKAIYEAMTFLEKFDHDGDGIPENEGFPDQTYDDWVAEGVTAYCGSLWIAACAAAGEMAKELGNEEESGLYYANLSEALKNFERKLWVGSYYKYSDRGKNKDSIMSDMLAGEWYARVCKLKTAQLPRERVISSLKTIYDYNVIKFSRDYTNGAKRGAVNGMKPNGKLDTSCIQSQEVWVGTNYALAALMIYNGLEELAWDLLEGIYKVTYEEKGYWFRTPEAWDRHGNFRATQYMRPLAVWAVQWALLDRLEENQD